MQPRGALAHSFVVQRWHFLWLHLKVKDVESRKEASQIARVKVYELRGKSKTDLFALLKDLKAELALLRVAKVTGGAPNKALQCWYSTMFALNEGTPFGSWFEGKRDERQRPLGTSNN
ncbi:60S ribosomal protein L35-like protein [Tanacetum coccineum]|uniref:60S ribosomal protein L35-like protein n=1 Tax=Tanacetum coccineum TaxID=301880 RepID=A0ABQ5FEW8_9ASTR